MANASYMYLPLVKNLPGLSPATVLETNRWWNAEFWKLWIH